MRRVTSTFAANEQRRGHLRVTPTYELLQMEYMVYETNPVSRNHLAGCTRVPESPTVVIARPCPMSCSCVWFRKDSSLSAPPFSRVEAGSLWARLVAGWADHLDPTGARTLIDGIPNRHDAGGSYEGVTRMLWGLGGWLSRPEREPVVEWRGKRYDIVELTRRALLAGTDPDSPGYWGVPAQPGASDQRTVESGQVAFALWQSRSRIWSTLTDPERARIIAWLDACGHRPPAWRNNWALFWALNHVCRKSLGVDHDESIITDVLAWLDDVYCGDGWYDDGAARGVDHFDDYTLWVFSSHVLAWAQVDGQSNPARRDELLERVRALMVHLPSFFSADGAYPEYGRSLSYKFARLGAPVWAYHAGVWPHSPGLLRRIVGRHIRSYMDAGAVRADGTLRQELSAVGNPDVRETYIATGSTYWAMQAFGALWTLADDDPFWTDEEEPLPVERGDFTRILPEPGWILVGSQVTRSVQRFSAKSSRYPAKYGKFVYATHAPFNAGLSGGMPSPDSMLCLLSGGHIGHRNHVLASAVGEPGWLRTRFEQRLGEHTHLIESVIVVRGECHLRVHRIHLADGAPPTRAVEGGFPLGYHPGAIPDVSSASGGTRASASDGALTSSISGVAGYDRAPLPAPWKGDQSLNSVYGRYVLPLLEVDVVKDGHQLACVVALGAADQSAVPMPSVEWLADGEIRVQWERQEELVIVPRLRA